MSSGSVKDFYCGKTVLLTGATGLIGRIMLAKLMRLGNVKEILLLSRPKKGKSNGERLKVILSGFLFDDMEKFDAKFESKLKIINGDMEIDGLQMSADDREYIKEHVEIILHGAATVRFDEQLAIAIAINIRGTKNILDIAVESKKLQSFVHISTAYSNCPRSDIDEIFYQPPMDYRRALQLMPALDNIADAITPKLIVPWPNTYTFTKAISEDMIRQYQDRLPIAIIRPSIIQSTLKDPVPGFVDKLLGPVGVAVGVHMGLVRVVKANTKAYTDVVPADIVVNSTLVIAWKVSRKDFKNDEVQVYNCAISTIRRIKLSNCLEYLQKNGRRFPTKRMIWLPRFTISSTMLSFRVLSILYHFIPALFLDVILKFQKSEIRLKEIYRKVFYHSMLLDFFLSQTWKFEDLKMRTLYRDMDKTDHEDFPVTMTSEDYEKHGYQGVQGLVKYFFKENDDDLKIARKRYKMFYMLHNIFLAVVYGLMALIGYRFIC